MSEVGSRWVLQLREVSYLINGTQKLRDKISTNLMEGLNAT